jgi:hypothetical protein
MKRSYFTHFTLFAGIAAAVVSSALVAQTVLSPTKPGGGLQPSAPASFPTLKRPDLTSGNQGYNFGFRIMNIGTGDAPVSTTEVTCRVAPNPPPSQTYVPCVEGTHYITVPGVPLPPGTMKTSGNTWKIATPPLAASSGPTGQFAFTLNIRSARTLQSRSLNFIVCADAALSINELNEGNNCNGFTYTWPN